jgi:hypothetical protein
MDDVQTSIQYKATASLAYTELTVNGDTDEMLTTIIADILSVHMKQVSYGNSVLSIISDTLAGAQDLRAQLDNASFKTSMQDQLSHATISSFEVNGDITTELLIAVDADRGTGLLSSVVPELESQYVALGWDTDCEYALITPGPSVQPTTSPFTTIPSPAPVMNGLVVDIVGIKTVTQSIDNSERDQIMLSVETNFEVDASDYDLIISYQAVGRLDVTSPSGTTAEVVDEIKIALASALGLHSNSISLDYDPNMGQIA